MWGYAARVALRYSKDTFFVSCWFASLNLSHSGTEIPSDLESQPNLLTKFANLVYLVDPICRSGDLHSRKHISTFLRSRSSELVESSVASHVVSWMKYL